jgi:hypothetical protein
MALSPEAGAGQNFASANVLEKPRECRPEPKSLEIGKPKGGKPRNGHTSKLRKRVLGENIGTQPTLGYF